MANRVETTADLNDGYSIITRLRLTSITNETGGVTTVAYDTPRGRRARRGTSRRRTPTPRCATRTTGRRRAPARPIEDWFNKYVVSRGDRAEHGRRRPAGPDAVHLLGRGVALRRQPADQVQAADLGPVARVPHGDHRDRHRAGPGDRDQGHLLPGHERRLPVRRRHLVGVADQHRRQRHGHRLQPVRRAWTSSTSSTTGPAAPRSADTVTVPVDVGGDRDPVAALAAASRCRRS